MWPCSGSKWCHLYWYYRFWVQKWPCPSRSSCLWSKKVLRRGNWIWGNDAEVVQNLRNALWQNVDRWWILASLLFQGREVQILFPLWGVRQNLDSWSHFCELSWIMNKVSNYEWFKIQLLINFSKFQEYTVLALLQHRDSIFQNGFLCGVQFKFDKN